MLLIDKIEMVLMDQLKQASWTYRPGEWETTVLFFEKDQITLKDYFLSKKRNGQAYVKLQKKYIISLKPMLRVRQFFTYNKNEPHSAITEQTYFGNLIRSTFSTKTVGSTGMLGISHMMRSHGYQPDIYKSIIPWEKEINQYETYKRLWRHDDIRKVIKGLGIEPKKSLSRMLLNHIYDDKNQELPPLRSLKFLWNLCPDENIIVDIWPHLCKNFSQLWELEPSHLKAWNCMLKGWPKHTRMVFARSLKKLLRDDYRLWNDTLHMIYQQYEAVGEVKVRGRNIQALHDNLSGESIKVELVKENKEIEYEDEIKQLHQYDFHNKVGAYTFILPNRSHEIVDWGKKLHNCMAGYVGRVQSRYTNLVGIIDRTNSKLIAGLEYRDGEIVQMSGYTNSQVDDTLKISVLQSFMDLGLIDSIYEKPKNRHYMPQREREMLDRLQYLPGCAPVVNVGVFGDNNNVGAVRADNGRMPF